MAARKKSARFKEKRAVATKAEVIEAYLDGPVALAALLHDKYVTLQMSEGVLLKARKSLGQDGELASLDDERLRPLVRHIEEEQARNAGLHGTRKIGDRKIYKAQRNKQRPAPYVHVPLTTFEEDGERLEDVEISWVDADTIVIKKVKVGRVEDQ